MQSDKKKAVPHDFGTQGRALLRVAGRRTGQNRWVRALYRAGEATARTTAGVARVLWLEVTGFLFLVIAIVGAGAGWREYRHYALGQSTFGRVAIAGIFALIFLYFGINSFWRSRKKK